MSFQAICATSWQRQRQQWLLHSELLASPQPRIFLLAVVPSFRLSEQQQPSPLSSPSSNAHQSPLNYEQRALLLRVLLLLLLLLERPAALTSC